MVGYQHQVTRLQALVDATGGVGHHQRAHAAPGERRHRRRHLGGREPLVQVIAPEEEQDGHPSPATEQELAGVPAHRRSSEPEHLVHRLAANHLDPLRQGTKPRAGDHRHCRLHPCLGEQGC
ncbi:hypothetical protein HRbin26_01131 [bacterium HR26]|nr:hypothetical protein HRbin26_01131 [bacterium HR26]